MKLTFLQTAIISSLSIFFPLASYAQEEESSTSLEKSYESLNNFAFVLSTHLAIEPLTNTFISPLSIFSTLSLIDLGAKGTTASEIAKTLQLTDSISLVSQDLATLLKDIKPSPNTQSYTLHSANGLWLDQDAFILSSFRHTAQDIFQAKIESLNFASEEKSLSIINEWTSNQTQGKIKNLLRMGDVNASTRMLVTNCLYFEGAWLYPFDEAKTKTAPFNPEASTSIAIKMMDTTGQYPYFENSLMQMVALPIEGKTDTGSSLSLVVILPEKGSSIPKMMGAMTSFIFRQWAESMDVRKVHITLPKFALSQKYELKEALSTLGMKEAFTPLADFSGINGMKDLFVSKVIHQALCVIDERGMSASSASAASLSMKSERQSDELPFEFLANHPFLFALIDTKTKAILFLGCFSNPDTGQTP